MVGKWLLLGWLFLVQQAGAHGSVAPADLPATDLARTWLLQDADVLEAEAGRGIAAQQARQLRMSSYEWSVRYQQARRRYPTGPASNEWTTQLERPLRLPNKRLIDRGLADTREALGDASFGETLYESARALVDLWMAWQETTELQGLIAEQVRAADENVRAVDARLRSGDAARLDLNLAEADAADVQRRMSEVRIEQGKARVRLEERFGVSVAVLPVQVEPSAITGTEESWKARILEQSDDLKMAQLELDQARRSNARVRADRIPDPTLGVYTTSEVFGQEKIVGFNVTVPLPGRYRSSRVAQTLSEMRAAEARLTRTERELATRIAETYTEAVGSFERWQLAQSAAQKAAQSAQLTRRAYTLGETDVQALILARRQALEAAVIALEARIAARRGNHHLLVDAHLIWDLDHE